MSRNETEHDGSLARIAMQKVVGSRPIIRSPEPAGTAWPKTESAHVGALSNYFSAGTRLR
jgi:hypothetical protein